MNIRLSNLNDLDIIFSIIKIVIEDMNNQNIFQWDDLYPTYEILKNDINNQTLFVIENNNKIVGITVLNEEQEPEYKTISWKYKDEKILVVHRLCIHPKYQGQGIAKNLINFTEQYAKDNNYNFIRLDAFKQNKKAVLLYEKSNYIKSGIVNFRKGAFYCFEKKI